MIFLISSCLLSSQSYHKPPSLSLALSFQLRHFILNPSSHYIPQISLPLVKLHFFSSQIVSSLLKNQQQVYTVLLFSVQKYLGLRSVNSLKQEMDLKPVLLCRVLFQRLEWSVRKALYKGKYILFVCKKKKSHEY